MCDNCKRGFQVENDNQTQRAKEIVKFFMKAKNVNQFTFKQTTDFLVGKKITSKFPINKKLIQEFWGSMKNQKEDFLRKIMIKMLRLSILEEEYVNLKAGMFDRTIIYVFLGRQADAILYHDMEFSISKGIEPVDSLSFGTESNEFDRTVDNYKSYKEKRSNLEEGMNDLIASRLLKRNENLDEPPDQIRKSGIPRESAETKSFIYAETV